MKALLYKNPGQAVLSEIPMPEIGPGEALLEVEVCGLCGTDAMKLATKAPRAILGHELCGRIAKLGKGVREFHEGDRVAVAHHVPCLDCHYCRRESFSMCRQFKETNIDPCGFAEYARLPALHVQNTMFLVPDGLDAAAASQMEPLACCLRNAKRLRLSAGDTVGVVGLGAIGQLTARLLNRHFGVEVIGLDLDAARAAGLKGFGQGVADMAAFEGAIKAATRGRGLDVLIFTIGTPGLVAQSLRSIRDGGTLNVFASFHPDPIMPLDLNEVYRRELAVVSSYSPGLDDLRQALDLIANKVVDPIFSDQRVYGLESFDQAVADVRARRATKALIAPKVLVKK